MSKTRPRITVRPSNQSAGDFADTANDNNYIEDTVVDNADYADGDEMGESDAYSEASSDEYAEDDYYDESPHRPGGSLRYPSSRHNACGLDPHALPAHRRARLAAWLKSQQHSLIGRWTIVKHRY